MTHAASVLRAEIDRHGPIAFSRFQELALYGPGGFYDGGGAGRRRDFLTSPEVGPLFGSVVARWLDAVWLQLDRPDPFVVVEPGAGPGSLAVAVLAAEPACAAVLRYVLVDRSAAQRRRQGEHLNLVPGAEAFAEPAESSQGDPVASMARGPLVVSLESMPRRITTGVVIANELVDNLPVDLLERTSGGWREVRVGFDGGFVEITVPTSDGPLARLADRFAPADMATGARLPIAGAAAAWLREATGALGRGRVLMFDYARPTAALAAAPMSQWLRTYRGHARGEDPLVEPGSFDITCDVAIDQLAAVQEPVRVLDQAAWLRDHGIDELVAEGRAVWQRRGGIGDLRALRARSRVGEAEALTDPVGLGGFTVMEWGV